MHRLGVLQEKVARLEQLDVDKGPSESIYAPYVERHLDGGARATRQESRQSQASRALAVSSAAEVILFSER